MTTCYQLLASVLPELPVVATDLAKRLGETRWIPGQVSESNAVTRTQAYVKAWTRWLQQEPSVPLGQHQSVATGMGEARLVRFPGRGKTPLLLLHGWPTSFLAFHRVVEPLQDVASEVVLAILPGFGAPEPMTSNMAASSIAALLADAMPVLGHHRFVVHGQDWGSAIARRMAVDSPQRVAGVHVSAGLAGFMAESPACGLQWERLRAFAVEGAGYLNVQSHRPDFLAVGLGDSPAGLLAWHLDKYQLWQEPLAADYGLGEDFILANATYYWATRSIGSSMRIYVDNRGASSGTASSVPTGVSVFGSGDFASREVSGRDNNLVAWYEHPNGGHIAALDAATDFVADLSDFIHRMEVMA